MELGAERSPGAIRISGRVVDDLDRPLPNRDVRIEARPTEAGLPARRSLARSDAAGRFDVDLELPLGRYEVIATHAGDAHHASASRAEPLDLTRAPVTLRFLAPSSSRVALDDGQLELLIEASSSEGANGLRVEVRDELERVLLTGNTDAAGHLRGRVPAQLLDEPGVVRLVLSSEGDERRLAGHGSRTIVAFRATHLELEASSDEQSMKARGRLSTDTGGLAGKAVGVFADGEHLATVLTEDDGRFEYIASTPALPSEGVRLEARFDSDAPWWESSRAGPVVVQPRRARPPSPLWLLIPLALAGMFLAWRGRVGRDAHTAQEWPAPNKPRVGVMARSPRLSLRPTSSRVRGVVHDTWNEVPLEGATIRLVGPEQRVASSDSAGRFHFDDLSSGQYRLDVAAHGFASEQATLEVPHRGEWSALRVGLESLRKRALQAYRPVATAVLPQPQLWDRWTLRETLAEAHRTGRGHPELDELTMRVERAAYARWPPATEEVALLQADGEHVLKTLEDPSRNRGDTDPPSRERGP